ncbi:MAG: InlB B-repeat-containing protein, partial [Candidatus Aenigmatarchaeota archaeon]
VEVEVSIPVDAGGEGSEITLEATSQTDPDVTDSDSMTVTLEEDYQVLVTAPPDRTENSSGNYTYSYQVENTGNTEDTYELDAQADRTGWSASPRRSTVTVAVGEMETVEVEVSVPEDIGGESSEITLEASSQNDAATVDSDSMNVTLEERLEVLVEAPADQTEKGSGTHTYTYEVENTGNTEDTYELSAFAVRTGWSASSQRTSITVAPGEVEEVKVDVEIPEDVSDGDSSEVILTAESQSDPDVSDSDPMIVSYSLEEVRDVMVEAPPEAVEEEPGTYTYSFEVQNTGNVADTYDLSIETSDWEVEAPTEVSVDEGSAEEVDVDLTIPEDVSEGETVEVTLTAVSQENGSASDSDSMSVTFRQEMEEYELTIEAGEGGTTDPEPGTYGYSEGTEVVVEALPDEGWYFTGWTGDYEGGEKEIVLTMDSDKEVMADFEEVGEGERVLTIFVDGEGSTDPESGSHVYEEGEEATVEALPGEGWYFERWSGDHQSEEKTLTIEMTENYTITAEFAPQVYGLEIDSTEGGEVVEPGEGMFEYEHGASVSLQAVADEGYHFVRWSGDNATIDDVVAGQTGITIEGNCTLTAEFAESEVWIEIKNPVDGEVYDDTEVEIEWTSKGADYHEIKLNDSDWIHMENATSYRFEELEEGNYTITIRAVGLGGNIVEDTVEFRVDPQQGSSSSSGSLLSSWWFLLFIPLVIFLFLLLWIGVKKKGEEEEKEREIEGFPTFKKIERSVPVGKGSSRWTSEKTIDREKSGGEKGKVQKKIKRVKKEGEGGGSKKIVRKKKKVKEPKGEADIEKSRPVMGVSGEKEESEEEKKLCQNCGIMIPEKKKICPECGHVSKEGSDEEYEEIFSLDDEIFSECPECGFLITDEEDECPYCDASLKDEAEEKRREKEKRPPDPLSSSTSEPKRKCPECGEDISEDQEVCHRCGSLLEEEDKI